MRKEQLMSDINFEKDQEEILDRTTNLKSLANQVKILRELEDQIKTEEESLKDKKKDLERISGEVIPTLLSEMGLSSLKLADGSAVDVKPYYAANISLRNREEAYNWLRSNGLGDIIKMKLPFPLDGTKITRRLNMLTLRRVRGINRHKS